MKSANTTQARPQPLARQEAGPWRRTLADWTVTIVVYLFVTTCVVQGYVIPTSSMEDTLLIGDHVLVDKLSYAPPDPWLGALLPYQQIERGDVIVFRYPLDLSETYVKRVVAIAGDRLRIDDKQVVLNGRPIPEPYKVHKTAYIDSYRDNFPSEPNTALPPRARSRCCAATCARASSLCRPIATSRWATTATFPPTAAIGDSCRARTSSASHCWCIGPTTRPPNI